MKNVCIFYGGKSVEHDISIITALQVMKNCPKGFNFIPIYLMPSGKMITADNLFEEKVYLNFEKNVLNIRDVIVPAGCGEIWILKKNKIRFRYKIDCALLCNHGHGGEDGSLQGALELAQIPYTSCDVYSSAICMDKELTKIILKNANIFTPSYANMLIRDYEENKDQKLKGIIDLIGYPCIVKPATLGSSVGISICEDDKTLMNACEEAFKFDEKIIIEKFLSNAREFCCAVVKLGDYYLTSNVTEVKKEKFYTFAEKYLTEKTSAKKTITKVLENSIKKLAMQSYKALYCAGVVRIDFLYDEKENKLFVNEANSIPGSLAFNLFDIPFPDLIASIIKEGINRFNNKKDIVYQFNSEAISKYIELAENYKKLKN